MKKGVQTWAVNCDDLICDVLVILNGRIIWKKYNPRYFFLLM